MLWKNNARYLLFKSKEGMMYEDEIGKFFINDKSIDISGIHPLYLCSSCRRKLDRYKSSTDE